jgi:hypothetical protein
MLAFEPKTSTPQARGLRVPVAPDLHYVAPENVPECRSNLHQNYRTNSTTTTLETTQKNASIGPLLVTTQGQFQGIGCEAISGTIRVVP